MLHHLSIVQSNPFRPSPSHSATESPSFQYTVSIFCRSALAGRGGGGAFFPLSRRGPNRLSASLADCGGEPSSGWLDVHTSVALVTRDCMRDRIGIADHARILRAMQTCLRPPRAERTEQSAGPNCSFLSHTFCACSQCHALRSSSPTRGIIRLFTWGLCTPSTKLWATESDGAVFSAPHTVRAVFSRPPISMTRASLSTITTCQTSTPSSLHDAAR